jgi:hypothetical protein
MLAEYQLMDDLYEGNWTVFVPYNPAFNIVMEEWDYATTRDIVLFHMIQDSIVTTDDMVCSGLLRMSNGRDSRTVCNGTRTYQKGAGNSPPDNLPRILAADNVSDR